MRWRSELRKRDCHHEKANPVEGFNLLVVALGGCVTAVSDLARSHTQLRDRVSAATECDDDVLHRRGKLRITSYNVCYTKLLRNAPAAVANDTGPLKLPSSLGDTLAPHA